MKTSEKGIDLIKRYEGLLLRAYRLPAERYFTIGYGHYGPDVLEGQQITRQEAEQLLQQDLGKFEGWVRAYTPFSLNQNQFDALVCFTYNCGPGSLRQLVGGRTAEQVAAHFTAYTGSASEDYREGLLRRRNAERTLYLTPMGDDLEMTKEELMRVAGTGDWPSAWAEEATRWAKEKGIFNGDGQGNYGWQTPITREAVAVILYEFARQIGL